MPKKILVVDDEKDVLDLVQLIMEQEGYEVVTARNGDEALQRAAADKPDLMVLDVMMPDMDGFQVLKKLKEDDATADIPVVMLTAKDQDADVAKGWRIGADLYLKKPFVREQLTAFARLTFEY